MGRKKGYFIKQSFNNDFVDFMEELYKKYGEEIFEIQGIANKHMDIAHFSKEFFKSSSNSVSDVSVDANANVNAKTVTQYTHETNKAIMKLNSYYVMYKKIKKLFSEEEAKEAVEKVINGELFVNDFSSYAYLPYCYAFDLRKLLSEGMDFFSGNMKIGAPQRSDSFIQLLIQTTAYISNQIAGACSYPDFFVALDWYYRKEFGNDYMKTISRNPERKKYIENQLQTLIYSFNFPFRGSQSAFTNLSVMDHGFLSSLFEGYLFPDLTSPDIESTLDLSKLFFEYYSHINSNEGMFTFPVVTLAVSVDDNNEYIDPDFVDWAAEKNSEKAIANIFQDKATSFSSCPLTSDTQVLLKSGRMGVSVKKIGQIVREIEQRNGTYEVWTGKNWRPFVPRKMEATDIVNITLSNGDVVRMGINHLQPVKDRGTLKASELKLGDWIPYNKTPIDFDLGNYDLGYAVGAFIGDGSYSGKLINYSLCAYEKDDETESKLVKFWRNQGYNTYKNVSNRNVRSVIIKGDPASVISQFVDGDNALNKKIGRKCFQMSTEFKQGLIEGLMATDGSRNSNRFYTASYDLVQSFKTLAAMMGVKALCTSEDNREEGSLGSSTVYRVDLPGTNNLKDRFQTDEHYIYYSIKSIKIEPYSKALYCFEVDDDSHLFTLGNGMITHNCRLKNDFSKISDAGFQNSFGVSGLSIGSHRVSGFNLARLAELEKEDPDIVEKDLNIIHKILYAHRQIIKERIDGGYLPLYSYDWIDLNKQYSTIGFVGAYEYLKNSGYEITDKEGRKKLQGVLKKFENKIVQWQEEEKEEKNIYNVEQIPAETMAVRLADIDNILGFNNDEHGDRIWELYSNQYIPLIDDASIYDRVKIQGEFDSLTSGGAILHLNVDDEKPISKEQFKKLMNQARLLNSVYFAINYAYSESSKGVYSIGKHDVCPVNGDPIIQQYTRVVGFVTPVKSWNKKRRDYEYENRKFYKNGELEIDKVSSVEKSLLKRAE